MCEHYMNHRPNIEYRINHYSDEKKIYSWSECLTCTIRASCCSARLSRAQVPTFAGSSVRDGEKTACTGGYKGMQAV